MYSALEQMKKYSCKDLKQLAQAGFDIHKSVQFNGVEEAEFDTAKRIKQYFTGELTELLKNYKELNPYIGQIEMFGRILRAYAQISEYETKVSEQKKINTLEKILADK